VHHVGILYDQFMMHGQRNIKLDTLSSIFARNSTSRLLLNDRSQSYRTLRQFLLAVFLFYVTSFKYNHTRLSNNDVHYTSSQLEN